MNIWCLREGEWVPEAIAGMLTLETDSPPPTPCLVKHESRDLVFLIGPPASVLLNGEPLHLGIQALADRDVIQLPGQPPLFFSTEWLPRVEPYPAELAPVRCPRCAQLIAPGDAAVRCGQCGAWYHQIKDDPKRPLTCWTYGETCLHDKQRTALDGEFHWTPREIWHERHSTQW